MNKSAIKKVGCLLLAAVTAFSVFGCKKKSKGESKTETQPMVFSIDAMDGNFNPFFSTSATDSTIAAMTQIGMLTSDADGKPVCGENEATVALSYTETYIDATGTVTTDAEKAKYTDYAFVIKNGVKFSDGVALTIKDVLFNLYVYLDPAYMGSSTIYSTDIVGLKAYQAQDSTIGDDYTQDLKEGFYEEADTRITNVLNHLNDSADYPSTAQIEADIDRIKELFREEARSDWSLSAGTQESFKDEYTFTEDWQIYLYNMGIIVHDTDNDGYPIKVNGKYVTNLDPTASNYDDTIAEEIDAATTAEEKKEAAIQKVINAYADPDNDLGVTDILYYFDTYTTARDDFAQDAMDSYYASVTDGVDSISGITTSKTTVNGAEHDVLNIRINGVDPKAIWNFSFAVAPMHYYSDQATIDSTPFGVKVGDKNFFQNVLQDPAKNGLPRGAGVYKASSQDGSAPTTSTFYNNNWVYFERNEYFETVGAELHNANIKYLRYRVVGSDKIIQALQTGEIHVGTPNATTDNLDDINAISSLSYKLADTNGYGYVGVNPKFVPDLEVRQAIMMAMNTSSIIQNYYTEALASTVYRSMSKTSWAYPKNATEYYAYTTSVTTIQNKVMEAKNSSGSQAWELKNGKFVNVETGKTLKYTFTIAGDTTDHPAYEMFMDAASLLNSAGFDITVATDIQALSKLAQGELAVWAAAWSSTIDPDLYQVYHMNSNATSVNNWGYPTILGDTEKFADEYNTLVTLSEKIEAARKTTDKADRTDLYAEALDLIMALAVELPTYQRKDLTVFNNELIDATTLNLNPTPYSGVTDRIWEINYNK